MCCSIARTTRLHHVEQLVHPLGAQGSRDHVSRLAMAVQAPSLEMSQSHIPCGSAPMLPPCHSGTDFHNPSLVPLTGPPDLLDVTRTTAPRRARRSPLAWGLASRPFRPRAAPRSARSVSKSPRSCGGRPFTTDLAVHLRHPGLHPLRPGSAPAQETLRTDDAGGPLVVLNIHGHEPNTAYRRHKTSCGMWSGPSRTRARRPMRPYAAWSGCTIIAEKCIEVGRCKLRQP